MNLFMDSKIEFNEYQEMKNSLEIIKTEIGSINEVWKDQNGKE